jgi:hypothetical protein
MDEFGDRGDVRVAHRQRRHAFVRAAAADHREEQLPVLIAEHHRRSQQVRPPELPAAQVHAVARAAGDRVERLPPFDDGGIARRPLLRGEDGGTSTSAAPLPASRW